MSPWSSPPILVPKPNGLVHFCIDFCKLNEVFTFDAYPMPLVDILIDRVGEDQVLSTIDHTKGYRQIPLTKEAQEKTVFTTRSGVCHFLKMAFRLHGAAASFQRVMDLILRDIRDCAVSYIDDILVFSPSWEAHLQHRRCGLDALRKAGFTANRKKSHIGCHSVQYLGFHIGGGKIWAIPDKVSALQKPGLPQTKKDLQRFLGLASYY